MREGQEREKQLPDTRRLIRLSNDAPEPTPAARRFLSSAQAVCFSAASIRELGLKWRKGKVNVQPRAVAEAALACGLYELGVEPGAILVSFELKTQHGDPFDRLLYAQAKVGRLNLLTVDEKIPRFGSAVVRAN
ncbi:MAG: type II toxin-antitoxin system VapC family toxin [Burkholderiales bacterium]|nr:type II toxin-antitoxin system VapC family toxin [Burkholderiales bacterium]